MDTQPSINDLKQSTTTIIVSFLKQLPLTSLMIGYLYFCGILYITTYWQTFHIDISNFITLSEIPKSFIYPFLVGNSLVFYPWFLDLVTGSHDGDDLWVINNAKIKRFLRAEFLFSMALLAALILTDIFPKIPKLDIYTYLIGIFIAHKLLKSKYVSSLIPHYPLKRYLILVLIFTPIFSMTLGKKESETIYSNSKIQYVKAPTDNSIIEFYSIANKGTQMKLLGFIGDKIIIGTLDNQKTFILNQSSVPQIELSKPIELVK